MLSCWQDPHERATLYFKKKPNGEHRPIFSYGLFRAAQQYMVLPVLEPRLRLHAGQYCLRGRGRNHAMENAKKQILTGNEWVNRADIRNCFPSLKGERVLAMLPGPATVMRTVILPPSEEYLIHPRHGGIHGASPAGVTAGCGHLVAGGSRGVGSSS